MEGIVLKQSATVCALHTVCRCGRGARARPISARSCIIQRATSEKRRAPALDLGQGRWGTPAACRAVVLARWRGPWATKKRAAVSPSPKGRTPDVQGWKGRALTTIIDDEARASAAVAIREARDEYLRGRIRIQEDVIRGVLGNANTDRWQLEGTGAVDTANRRDLVGKKLTGTSQ